MGKPNDVVIVVDEQDNVLAHKKYSDTLPNDRWRDTAVFVFNNKGKVLLAQRHPNKKVLPNRWGPAASGTVESHESYEQNAYKELEEEIGLKDVNLRLVGTYCADYDAHYRFTGLFVGIWDGSINKLTLEEGQVAAVKWMNEDEFVHETSLHTDIFVPKMAELYKLAKNAIA